MNEQKKKDFQRKQNELIEVAKLKTNNLQNYDTIHPNLIFKPSENLYNHITDVK